VIDFDWVSFYTQQDGASFLEHLREQWIAEYDFILLDSREGLTDVSGICTVFMPDILVLVVTANEQSLKGTEYIISVAESSRQKLHVSRAPLTFVPLISRWDGREEQKEAETWLNRIKTRLRGSVEDWYPQDRDIDDLFTSLRIPHVAYFSFGEKLPVLTHNNNESELPGFYYKKLADVLETLSDPDADLNNLLQPTQRGGNLSRKVFISSTSIDMNSFRKIIAEVLTKQGLIVQTQNDFASIGEPILSSLKEMISQADAFILLIGKNYGTTSPDGAGKSYAQLEYEWAKQIQKPTFCFLNSDDVPGGLVTEFDTKQARFIEQIRSNTIYYTFQNGSELRKLGSEFILKSAL